MTPPGYVALVLHAHLPFVRHPEHVRSLEERWFFEALWECYLPLLDVFGRLEAEGVPFDLTLSISPTLGSMLRDDHLRGRFGAHLESLGELLARERARAGDDADLAPILAFYEGRLATTRDLWERHDGDVLAALIAHRDAGRLDLVTTAATHAYLPGLRAADPGGVRAQLRVGLRAHRAFTGETPLGLWLPECAFEPALGADLRAAGVAYTVLDAHGLFWARPEPPLGVHAPILDAGGVAYFARDPAAAREVWSREVGYPGAPDYRDFYRDIGFDRTEDELGAELGPRGTRVMTGLKYHRIAGPNEAQGPYRPEDAARQARIDAEDFVARRLRTIGAVTAALGPSAPTRPIVVAPYDAELFGHWWFEGPAFLEHVLRDLAAARAAGGPEAISLRRYLERHPDAVVAEPSASTWGEGGFGEVWSGPRSAATWRHVHQAGQRLARALAAHRDAAGTRGRALDQAVREVLLLQSSDWPFMLHRGEFAEYAESRLRAHAHRAAELVAIATGGEPDDVTRARVQAIADRDRFLPELAGRLLRDAFDPW